MKENLAHFKRHYRRNYVWIWISMATYGLSYFTYTVPHGFDSLISPFGIFRHLQDPIIMVVEIIVATYSLVVSLWNISQLWAKPLRSASLMFVWVTFSIGLLAFDISNRMFSLDLLLTIFMAVLVFETSRIGNNREREK